MENTSIMIQGTVFIAHSLVAHDHLSKVICIAEKGLVLIYYRATGWRVYVALVGKGLIISFNF